MRLFWLVGLCFVLLLVFVTTTLVEQGKEPTEAMLFKGRAQAAVILALAREKDCPQLRIGKVELSDPVQSPDGKFSLQGSAEGCGARWEAALICPDWNDATTCAITLNP